MLGGRPGLAGPTRAVHPRRPSGSRVWKGRSAMAQHPLEPLSADEFRRTAEILRRDGHVTDTFRFASIELPDAYVYLAESIRAWRD